MNNAKGIARVGVTPYCRDDGSQYFPQGYIDGIEAVGAELVPIWYETPLSALFPLVVSLDALLFSGGGDIDPCHYGQRREALCSRPNPVRDQLELALADLVLGRNIPVLGICRGMQLLNVALGGTLKQNIEGHRSEPDFGQGMWHDIRIEPGSRVHGIVGAEVLRANSFHHQCVDEPGEGLLVTARAEDGVIEAIELPGDRFVVGVQWHPEKSLKDDDASLRFFEALRAEMR
ncbi:MAG: gamma-glutamyl-gamma-aminobutyrate hydrolase family protein [Clostridiales bacterium]|nr:gamma-glutamyl-gamma-aminobutyrate hydrolase family protein [Clostridiales bacterium]